MSQRTRAGKARNARPSTSKGSPKSNAVRKVAAKKSNVKTSPSNKRSRDQTPSTSVTRRQKRLSGLTAATLLQYCTNILSPSSNDKQKKRPLRSTTTSPSPKKVRRNSSKQTLPVDVSTVVPTRSRREASSRASAMIMQQNEIERSRFNYTVSQPSSSSNARRAAREKSPPPKKEENPSSIEPVQSQVPPVSTSSENVQTTPRSHGTKYQILSETLLAEHDRLNGTIPSYHSTKRENLIKWIQGLRNFDCTSPPPLDTEKTPSVVPIPIVTPLTSSLSTGNLNPLSRSLSFAFGQGTPGPTTTTTATLPNFLPPSTAYPIGLRSFYPLLPCWQYPAWPFQPSTSLVNSISISSSSITAIPKKTSLTKVKTSHSKLISLGNSKQEALTFHLHTHHHHHHIHNGNGSTTCTTPVTSIDPTIKVQSDATIPVDPSKLSNGIEKHEELVRKTPQRKSSPIEKRVRTRSQVHRSPGPSNAHHSSSSNATVIKRSVRGQRTRSSPIVSRRRSPSASDRKRTHSSTSVHFPLPRKDSPKRKKQKVSHYWTLCGKSERKLVSLQADQPPVYRKCYSFIRHVTEKEIIRSDDCVVLRPDTGRRHGATPYVAKVKWFWEEPLTGEIQMSLIWYYHPEHTELSSRVKEHFLTKELVASKYWDCINVACIEDKCYVLNLHEYNRYSLREKSKELFDHPEPVGKLKSLLNKNTSHLQHRPLPRRSVDEENVFFCRYVYDYRAKRLIKNPSLSNVIP